MATGLSANVDASRATAGDSDLERDCNSDGDAPLPPENPLDLEGDLENIMDGCFDDDYMMMQELAGLHIYTYMIYIYIHV